MTLNGSTRSLTISTDANKRLDVGLHAVERRMLSVVDSEITVLRDASRHILEAGGKRVRPRLTILAYLATGGEDPEAVADIAAAVELVHTASVVHDDINDHGVLRRGRPSVNAKWGRTFALLTGDFLFTKVYELMAPYKDLNVVLAEATVALVEGETLQASAVKEKNFTRAIYNQIIALKTAALFRAAGKLGGKLAHATDEQAEALGNFGFDIGIAFQIIDDVLDLVGDETQLGKTAGIDVEQGRGFAAAETTDVMDSIKAKMLKGDTLEDTIATARDQAQRFIDMAIQELDVLPDSDAKDALIDLAHMVIDRAY